MNKLTILGVTLLDLMALPHELYAQEYRVRAVDAKTGKVLKGIPITLRYGCAQAGVGTKATIRCKFVVRKTGRDGIAHFPEAGSLKDIDDVFSAPITYNEECCDISKPVIPGEGTITFLHRSFGQTLHWVFLGD
jgi:hypothetical protein